MLQGRRRRCFCHAATPAASLRCVAYVATRTGRLLTPPADNGRPKAAALLQLADPQCCICFAGVCARRACCQPDPVINGRLHAGRRLCRRSGGAGRVRARLASGHQRHSKLYVASRQSSAKHSRTPLSRARARNVLLVLKALRAAAHGTAAARMQTPSLRLTPLLHCSAPGARRARATRPRVSIVCAASSKPDSVYACPLPEPPARAEDSAVYACLLPEAPSPGAQPMANTWVVTR